MSERLYSEEEVAEAVRRASEDASDKSAYHEVVAAATEAGIPAHRIEAELAKSAVAASASGYATTLPFPVPPAQIPAALADVPGGAMRAAKVLGGSVTSMFDLGIDKYSVDIAAGSDVTEIRIKLLPHGRIFLASMLGVAGLGGLILGFSQPLLLAGSVFVLGVAVAAMRGFTRGRAKRIKEIGDGIASRLAKNE